MKKLLFSIISLFMIFTLGCNRLSEIQEPVDVPAKVIEKEQYLKIMTTNKLLYYMVKDIVKDKHLVDYMLKAEEDQWNFKYTEDSLRNIGEKDLFMYMDGSYEPWVNGFLEELKKSKVGIINTSRGIKLLTLSIPRKYVDENKKEVEYKENPYYWLNPDDYKIALSNIKNSIQERDPKNRDFYEANFDEAIKNIDRYSKDLKSLEAGFKKYTFITVEDDFDYFVRFMNIKTVKLTKEDLELSNSDKLNKKLRELGDIALLYNNEININPYSSIIERYNIKTVNMITYKFDMNIIDIFKNNYDSISKLNNIQ